MAKPLKKKKTKIILEVDSHFFSLPPKAGGKEQTLLQFFRTPEFRITGL
jgi:hypothetical protein